MNRLLVVYSLAALLAACSSTNQPVKVVVLAPKPAPPAPIAARAVQRTPGSLWSDESRWNEMYSHPTSRIVGDYVTFKISDSFRSRIIAQMPPEPEVKKRRGKEVVAVTADPSDKEGEKERRKQAYEDAKNKNKDVDRNDPALKAEKAKEKETEARLARLAAKQGGGQSPDSSLAVLSTEKLSDSPTIEGSIRSVLPRGSYSVYASQVLVIGGKPCVVSFDGQIREEDIDQNVASAELVSNLRLDVETKDSLMGKNAPREDGEEQP